MWCQDRFFNDKRKIIQRKENIKVLNSCWPYLMDKKSHSKWYWNFNYFIINMLIMKSKAHLDKKSLHHTLILQGTEGSQTHERWSHHPVSVTNHHLMEAEMQWESFRLRLPPAWTCPLVLGLLSCWLRKMRCLRSQRRTTASLASEIPSPPAYLEFKNSVKA